MDLPEPLPNCSTTTTVSSLGFYYNAIVLLLLSLIYTALKQSKQSIQIVKEIASPDGTLNNFNFYNFRNIQGNGISIFVSNIKNSEGLVLPDQTATFVYQVPENKKALINSVLYPFIGISTRVFFDVFDKDNNFEYRAYVSRNALGNFSSVLTPLFLLQDGQIIRAFSNGSSAGPGTLDVMIRGCVFDASVPINQQTTLFQTSDPVGSSRTILSKPPNTSTTIRRVISQNLYYFELQNAFNYNHSTIPIIPTPYTQFPFTIAHDFFIDQNFYNNFIGVSLNNSAYIFTFSQNNLTLMNNEFSLQKFSLQNTEFFIHMVYFDETISS